MKNVRSLLASLAASLVLAGAAGCGSASPAPAGPASSTKVRVGDDAALAAIIDPWFDTFGAVRGETHAISGYVLVVEGQRTRYARGFGFADREKQLVPTADTSFRIGSTTKQFTSAAIMLLAQDGKLAVDQPIKAYLPNYPAVGANITLHQLMSHTSGLREYLGELGEGGFTQKRTTAELLAIFQDLPLDFPSGTKWAYSNSNYLVLGAIIEAVSGTSYAEFMRTRIFEPAGLHDTTVGDAEGAANRALGYNPKDGTLAAAGEVDMSVPFAAGAIRSTANDLVRWNDVLAANSLLSAASREQMETIVKDDYGYGWWIRDIAGQRVVEHGGNIHGFNTGYMRVPSLDLTVVAWSNNAGVNGTPLAMAALKAALGEPLEPHVEQAVASLNLTVAKRAVGSYQMTADSRVKAEAMGLVASAVDEIAELVLAIEGTDNSAAMTMKVGTQQEIALLPLGDLSYEVPAAGISLVLEQPAGDGPILGVVLTQGPLRLEFRRLAP